MNLDLQAREAPQHLRSQVQVDQLANKAAQILFERSGVRHHEVGDLAQDGVLDEVALGAPAAADVTAVEAGAARPRLRR